MGLFSGIALAVLLEFLFAVPSHAQLRRTAGGQIPVGNSDTNGFARIDVDLGDLDLGGGADASLFLMFTTNPRREAGYLGAYWCCPFLESKLVKTHEISYKWTPPNNGGYTFYKVPGKVKGWDEVYEMKGRGGWSLKVSKSGAALIESLSDPAARYEFKRGRLVSFCAGSGSDRIRINYDSNGIPLGVYNVSRGRSLLDLRYDGSLLVSIKIGASEKGEVKLSYLPCDALADDGQSALKDKSLRSISAIRHPAGRSEEFSYAAVDGRPRKVTRRNWEESSTGCVPLNRLVRKVSGNESWLEWDAGTGIIVADSGGEYAVMNPAWDRRHPEYGEGFAKDDRRRADITRHTRISYKRPENMFPEILEINHNNATRILQDPNSGEMKRVSYIGAQGPSYMKERKVERKSAGEKDWRTDAVKAYDEKGLLVREILGNGDVVAFAYNKDGGLFEKRQNGQLTFFDAENGDGKPVENGGELLWFLKITPDGAMEKVSMEETHPDRILYRKWNPDGSLVTSITQSAGRKRLELGGFEFLIGKTIEQNKNN